MDAKVITAFRDIENLEDEYQPGDMFSGTAERVKSLAERGFVEVVEKPKPARKRAAKPKE